jgi:hypothetical protein
MYFSHIGNRFCYRSQCLASMSAREDVCDQQGTSINKRKHIRIMSWCIRYSLLPYLPTAALALKTVFPTPLHSPNVCACEAVCVELGRVCHWRWGSFDAPLYLFESTCQCHIGSNLVCTGWRWDSLEAFLTSGNLFWYLHSWTVLFFSLCTKLVWLEDCPHHIGSRLNPCPQHTGKKRKNDETRWNTFMPRLCQAYRN